MSTRPEHRLSNLGAPPVATLRKLPGPGCCYSKPRGWPIIAGFVLTHRFFMLDINAKIAEELGVVTRNVAAAVALLDEGSTVPFIARYRKEVTGSLDDTQLRTLEESTLR